MYWTLMTVSAEEMKGKIFMTRVSWGRTKKMNEEYRLVDFAWALVIPIDTKRVYSKDGWRRYGSFRNEAGGIGDFCWQLYREILLPRENLCGCLTMFRLVNRSNVNVIIECHSQGEYFRCPPPMILIFGYVIEDRKIRNTWKLRSKLGLKNHFCGKNGLFENLVSQSYFAFKDTKFVQWHYSPIPNSSRDIPQKWFFIPNFERSFHVFLIFRSSITYPKIKMIGGGHLKYSPCQTSPFPQISHHTF